MCEKKSPSFYWGTSGMNGGLFSSYLCHASHGSRVERSKHGGFAEIQTRHPQSNIQFRAKFRILKDNCRILCPWKTKHSRLPAAVCQTQSSVCKPSCSGDVVVGDHLHVSICLKGRRCRWNVLTVLCLSPPPLSTLSAAANAIPLQPPRRCIHRAPSRRR